MWDENDMERLILSLKNGQFIQPVIIASMNSLCSEVTLILDGQPEPQTPPLRLSRLTSARPTSIFEANRHTVPPTTKRFAHFPALMAEAQLRTLPAFVRNRIDHPDPTDPYTDDELRVSTELLRQIIQNP